MPQVKFYETAEDSLLKFAVIISDTEGKWVFCKHKERDTYEIPGGRRETGESILETAWRELREETGYIGTVQSVIPQGYSSPGMTGETVYIAKMTVVESDQKELKTEFDDAEDIETILVSPEDLPELIRKEHAAGNGVDIKVTAYSAAIS